MTDTVEVVMKMPKPPEGWEYTGEARPFRIGEAYLRADGTVCAKAKETVLVGNWPILRRVKPAFVTVKLPRGLVVNPGKTWGQEEYLAFDRACRAALAKEDACST